MERLGEPRHGREGRRLSEAGVERIKSREAHQTVIPRGSFDPGKLSGRRMTRVLILQPDNYARHDNKKTAATVITDAALHKNEWRWKRFYPL